jgi:hypothetical protein
VRWAFDGFGTFKAAGEDGIFPGLLPHEIEIIIGHITKIFAACLAYGYIPLEWRALSVIGRDSYELVLAFRPIRLISFFLNTMERLVDSFIRVGPLKSFRLLKSQYAYQRADPLRLIFTILFKRLRGA